MSNTWHHGDKAKERKFGSYWWWYKSEPKWWRKMMHTRPKRAENKRLCHRVKRGETEQVWPVGSNRPHDYYW